MTVGLFSYHADYATSHYIAQAIRSTGEEIVLLGFGVGENSDWCTSESHISDQPCFDTLLFVDPPGGQWLLGFEHFNGPKIAYLIDVHQSLDIRLAYAPFFDAIFVAQKDYVKYFQRLGYKDTYWLPLGCDPQVHRVVLPQRDLEVAFVGKLGKPEKDRSKLLKSVQEKYATNDFSRFYPPGEMAQVYGNSKIGINASINGDLNMRLFEILAYGALLVTDRISNGLDELFLEDNHYVGFSSIEEAFEKIDYYLARPDARQLIAKAGQEAALNHHTYQIRWEHMKKSGVTGGKALIHRLDHEQRIDVYAEVFEILRLPQAFADLIGSSQSRIHKVRLGFRWLIASLRKLNANHPFTPAAIREARKAN